MVHSKNRNKNSLFQGKKRTCRMADKLRTLHVVFFYFSQTIVNNFCIYQNYCIFLEITVYSTFEVSA